MRIYKLTLLVILAFAASAFGQNVTVDVKLDTPTPTPTPSVVLPKLEDLERAARASYKRPQPEEVAWKLIALSQDGTTWKYRTWTHGTSGDVEVWLKVQPTKPVKHTQRESPFSRRTTTRYISYTMQFATLHCGDGRYSIESLIPYDTRGNPIVVPTYGMSIFRSPPVPGSTVEYIYKFFCQ